MGAPPKANRRLGRAATTTHLCLAAFVSAVLMLAPPRATAQCVNLAGNWNYSESGTVTLVVTASDGEYASETDPVSGSGQVTITQTGSCTFQYLPIPLSGSSLFNQNLTQSQLQSLARTVTVMGGNNVTETGTFVVINYALAEQEGLTITSVSPNVYTGTGQVTADVLELNASGATVVMGYLTTSGGAIDFTLTITASSSAFLFAINPPLTLSVSKVGSGTVTSTDGDINCGTECSYNYLIGTQVTLNATPAQGWTFSGWSGACGGTGPCIVNMTQAESVGAMFDASLTVSILGSGHVMSTPPDNSINCPPTCSHSYPPNTVVTLNTTAGPPPVIFGGWCAGPCSDTESCAVTITQPQSVGALFIPVDFIPEPGGPNHTYIDLDKKPSSMYGAFTPKVNGSPVDLVAAANVCGFKAFDWRQTVDANKGGVWAEETGAELKAGPICGDPPCPPYSDPPPGAYTYDYDCLYEYPCGKDICYYPNGCDCTGIRNQWLKIYQPNFAAANPFYYSALDLQISPSGCAVGNPPSYEKPLPPKGKGCPKGTLTPGCQLYMTSAANSPSSPGVSQLNFWDKPGNSACHNGEPCFKFTTQLVGVCVAPSTVCNLPTNPPSALLYEWTWESNYNNLLKIGCAWITSENSVLVLPPACR